MFLAHPLGFMGEQPQQAPQPQQPQQPQQPEQKQQKEMKHWDKFVPGFVDTFADKYLHDSEKATEKRMEQKKAEEKAASSSKAAPALFASADGGDYSEQAAKEEASLRAVSSSLAEEAEAKSRAQRAMAELREAKLRDVIGEAGSWESPSELAASSAPKDTQEWEKALDSRIKLLERFNNEKRRNVLDFNASRAVELVYAVETASAHVEQNIKKQEENMKSKFKTAKVKALQKVKALEFDVRSAASNWKAVGKKAVKAQKSARMSENVYERHDDEMSDDVGDLKNSAENKVERLEDEVGDYFSRMEDDLRQTAYDKRARELSHSAKQAISHLHEVARHLGAQAAFQEAESSARFRAEEKRWESFQAPEAFFTMPGGQSPMMLAGFVFAVSFVSVSALLRRRSSRARPMDIEAPPLLG